ncbi:hypothetical protein ABZZ04_14185 [Streptomyces sp. NPDC006435]
MADETGIDQCDAVVGGDGRDQPCGLGRIGGDPDVEAQRPKIVRE